jgi:hypothetical protein
MEKGIKLLRARSRDRSAALASVALLQPALSIDRGLELLDAIFRAHRTDSEGRREYWQRIGSGARHRRVERRRPGLGCSPNWLTHSNSLRGLQRARLRSCRCSRRRRHTDDATAAGGCRLELSSTGAAGQPWLTTTTTSACTARRGLFREGMLGQSGGSAPGGRTGGFLRVESRNLRHRCRQKALWPWTFGSGWGKRSKWAASGLEGGYPVRSPSSPSDAQPSATLKVTTRA